MALLNVQPRGTRPPTRVWQALARHSAADTDELGQTRLAILRVELTCNCWPSICMAHLAVRIDDGGLRISAARDSQPAYAKSDFCLIFDYYDKISHWDCEMRRRSIRTKSAIRTVGIL
jgi:hypothetical protein